MMDAGRVRCISVAAVNTCRSYVVDRGARSTKSWTCTSPVPVPTCLIHKDFWIYETKVIAIYYVHKYIAK